MKDFEFLIFAVIFSTVSLAIGLCIGGLMQSREVLATQDILERNYTFSSPEISTKIYLSSFDEIIKEVSSGHEYDLRKYNCQNFSKSLTKRLSDEGYDAKICYGNLKNCDNLFCGHAWVKIEEIYIEATTGKIITPSKYEGKYEEKICK